MFGRSSVSIIFLHVCHTLERERAREREVKEESKREKAGGELDHKTRERREMDSLTITHGFDN